MTLELTREDLTSSDVVGNLNLYFVFLFYVSGWLIFSHCSRLFHLCSPSFERLTSVANAKDVRVFRILNVPCQNGNVQAEPKRRVWEAKSSLGINGKFSYRPLEVS